MRGCVPSCAFSSKRNTIIKESGYCKKYFIKKRRSNLSFFYFCVRKWLKSKGYLPLSVPSCAFLLKTTVYEMFILFSIMY